jgi:hypothetical protein
MIFTVKPLSSTTLISQAETSASVNIVPLRRSAIVSTASLRAFDVGILEPTVSVIEMPSWALKKYRLSLLHRQEQNVSQPPQPGTNDRW